MNAFVLLEVRQTFNLARVEVSGLVLVFVVHPRQRLVHHEATTTNRTIRLNGPGLSVVLCFNTHAANAGKERDAVALRDKTAGEGPKIDTMIAR